MLVLSWWLFFAERRYVESRNSRPIYTISTTRAFRPLQKATHPETHGLHEVLFQMRFFLLYNRECLMIHPSRCGSILEFSKKLGLEHKQEVIDILLFL